MEKIEDRRRIETVHKFCCDCCSNRIHKLTITELAGWVTHHYKCMSCGHEEKTEYDDSRR